MFLRLKQPIFSPLPSFVYPSACCIAVDHNYFVTVKTLQMFCFAPFLHAAPLLNLILNFLFHFRACVAERIHLKNSAKDLSLKTRLDHPEIPQNCKSSQLCCPSSSAQCSVEILSSLFRRSHVGGLQPGSSGSCRISKYSEMSALEHHLFYPECLTQ